MTMNPTTLGRNVRLLRGCLRLSQGELASGCGLSIKTVSDLELGLVDKPQAGTLARLAEVLKTTVAALERDESESIASTDSGSPGPPVA